MERPKVFLPLGSGSCGTSPEMFRLHFGKPYADITVDAHAINSQGDLSRELGWYVGQARESRGNHGNRGVGSGLGTFWGDEFRCILFRFFFG